MEFSSSPSSYLTPHTHHQVNPTAATTIIFLSTLSSLIPNKHTTKPAPTPHTTRPYIESSSYPSSSLSSSHSTTKENNHNSHTSRAPPTIPAYSHLPHSFFLIFLSSSPQNPTTTPINIVATTSISLTATHTTSLW